MQAAPGRPPAQVQSAAQGWQEGAGGVLAAASPPHSREQSRHQPERGSRAAGTPCLRCVPVSPFPKGISSYGHGMAPARLSPGPARARPRPALGCNLRSAPSRSAPPVPRRSAHGGLPSALRCALLPRRRPARPGPWAPLPALTAPAPLRSALRSARAAARSLPLRLPPGGNPAPLQPLRPPPRQPPPGPGTAPGPGCGEAAGAGSARPRSVRGERGRPGWGTPAEGTAAGLASLPRPPQPYGIGSCKSRVFGICGTAAVQTGEEGTHFAGLLCNAVRRSAGSTCRSPPAHRGTGTGYGSGQGCWDLH